MKSILELQIAIMNDDKPGIHEVLDGALALPKQGDLFPGKE